MDMDFETVVKKLVRVESNIASLQEFLVEVERTIRMIKEWLRGIINTLPYYFLPDQITTRLVYFMIMWLNALSDRNGI